MKQNPNANKEPILVVRFVPFINNKHASFHFPFRLLVEERKRNQIERIKTGVSWFLSLK